jgi:hypothetical protein
VIILSLLFSYIVTEKREYFDQTSTMSYTGQLLNSVAPIIYDSSNLSKDKIESLQKLNPPLTDPTILSYINSSGDADGIISNIKIYLGSCPKNPATPSIPIQTDSSSS